MSQPSVWETFQQRLTEKGLKTTRQRQVIVETFFELDRHVSVDDLLAEVRKRRRSTGYATVYRTLKLLVELDLAGERRFGGPDSATLYDPVYGREEHFHLICSDCQQIIEFADARLDALHHQIAADHGFAVQTQRLELYARCVREDCPRKQSASTQPPPASSTLRTRDSA